MGAGMKTDRAGNPKNMGRKVKRSRTQETLKPPTVREPVAAYGTSWVSVDIQIQRRGDEYVLMVKGGEEVISQALSEDAVNKFQVFWPH
jgi:hypothetical protein